MKYGVGFPKASKLRVRGKETGGGGGSGSGKRKEWLLVLYEFRLLLEQIPSEGNGISFSILF
jgi:hypothetical protein